MDVRKAAPWYKVLIVMLLATGGLAASGDARAAEPVRLVKYGGIHPLPPHAGEFCHIDLLHVHAQAPSDMRAYRVMPDQRHVFVGDEAALGYDGPKHAYFGPHPVTVPGAAPPEPLFCYLRGAHFHAAPPTPAAAFVMKEGVAWFTGPFAPTFERDRFNVWVNDVRPIAAYRPPQVDLAAAPPGYQLPAAVAPPVMPPALPPALPPPSATAKGDAKARAKSKGAAVSPADKTKPRPAPAAGEGVTP